jgi:hypothetical protein
MMHLATFGSFLEQAFMPDADRKKNHLLLIADQTVQPQKNTLVFILELQFIIFT